MEKLTGTIAGYDPGGNGANGFALLKITNNIPTDISITTLSNAESVINEIHSNNVIGLGVDTLSCWSTGHSGWRPADLWLRKRYPAVQNSIMSPNTLSGSMGLNGMSVLMEAVKRKPSVMLSETHPKVLYYALHEKRYNYVMNHEEMDSFLSSKLELSSVTTSNDHEWDAAISAYALFMGMTGRWTNDLHSIPLATDCRIVKPCGETFYYWPDA